MSRLTGNDAYGLMEAYSAVYQPRLELTEEQIWEEVENFVNELIEEGYDLSEYTWEDMYEAYINEISAMHVQLAAQPKPPAEVRKAPAKKPSPADYAPAAGTALAGGAAVGTMARGMRRKSKPGVSPVFKEAVDVYDVILSHLLDEGYAETPEAAEAIMVNMSEEWREDIMEISDRLATAARNTRQRRLTRSVARADTYADAGYQKQNRKSERLNQTIASRNQRTGSQIKPVD